MQAFRPVAPRRGCRRRLFAGLRLFCAAGLCGADDAARVSAHFHSVGLPDGLLAAGIGVTGAVLVDHMRHDKKMAAGTLPFLLVRGIGQTFLDRSVDLADVETFLDAQPR